MQSAIDAVGHTIFVAGQLAPAGHYRDTETGRDVVLHNIDYLPASLDGRVAEYTEVEHTLDELRTQVSAHIVRSVVRVRTD